MVDDYGTGGIWAVVIAPSRATLEKAYPDLVVFEQWPGWMDEAEYARIRSERGFRADQPTGYWARFYRP